MKWIDIWYNIAGLQKSTFTSYVTVLMSCFTQSGILLPFATWQQAYVFTFLPNVRTKNKELVQSKAQM